MPRKECDRFVSLAFCAAEVPLEVDEKWTITYPAGGISALTDFERHDAIGKRSPNRPGGKFYVAGRLDALMLANRHEPIMLRLNGPNGRTLRMMLTGYYLPDLPGSFFFALYLTGKDEFLNNADNPRRTRIRDRSDSIAWPARDDGGAKSISAGECEGRSGNDVESSIIQRSYPVDADLPCEDIPRRGAQVDLGQLRHDGNGF